MKKLFVFYYIFFLLVTNLLAVPAAFAAPPTNFQTTQIIGTGLDGPSAFDFAPDGRIFILQRTGEVKIYKNGQLLANNFAVLPSIASGDRGLIGIAFDPDFANNHYAYFYYTGLDKLNHLVRFDASGDTGINQIQLYQTNSPSEQLHVGGTIRFGPDGKLYFAIGDNGYGPNAQDLSNPHGKIMRINKDGSIPTDNPFYGQPGKLPEIWAYGLRNPWRFQFDSVTGDLYDGDVGADSWEEINRIVKGGNYGWPTCEGMCVPAQPQYIDPLYTYPHNINGVYQSSAVTQGPVYHGSMFPQEYQNSIFYGDYARGTIRRLTLGSNGGVNGDYDFDMQAGSVVDLKTASDGSLYYITYYPGRLYRISYSTSNHVPVANASADNVKGLSPFTVNFSSAGSYDPDNTPISYAWDFGDGTTSTMANPAKTYTKNGTYTVELTVSDGVNIAQARPLVIQVGCPPNVTIGTPKDGSTYNSGDSITVNASAIDCAGFDINDASLSTTVKFHHTTHIHPFLDNLPGRSNTFTVPVTGEPSADTWFEIDVTATDTNRLSTTAVTNIYPNKSNLTFVTQPAGLQILLDGQPTATTQTIQGVVGYQREINIAGTPQQLSGKSYVFDHWSDGGAQRHTITTISTNTTYTAYFKETTMQQDPPLAYTIYDELLGGDWIDWSWNSSNDFAAVTSYTGSNAIGWTAKQGWAGFFVHRNELPLDLTGFDSLTFALRATQAGQKVRVQFYDTSDKPVGHEIDVANYGGDPVAGSYKVYTIPLAAFGVTGTKINDIHLQNYTDNPQPVMYIDRFGLTQSAQATPTPTPTGVPTITVTPTISVTLTPTTVPTVTPTVTPASGGTNVVQNNSFETTGTNWLNPWKFDVWGAAAGTISQDTTMKSSGSASAKVNITKVSPNIYEAQFYQSGIPVTAGKSYTVSFSAKAGSARNIQTVLQQVNTPYTVYWQKTVALTTAWKKFVYTVTPAVSDQNAFIGFNMAGKTGNVWIDDVSVCSGTCEPNPSGTPTPTSTPTITPTFTPSVTPTPTVSFTPTPTPMPSGIYKVFDDAVTAGWDDWSWDAANNFSITSPVYFGTSAISYIANAAWSGFSLHNTSGVDTTPYTTLHFALQASQPGQKYAVFMDDANGNHLTAPIPLANYGGDAGAGNWKVFDIPLVDLNASNKKVYEISIHEISGAPQPALYIDELQLK